MRNFPKLLSGENRTWGPRKNNAHWYETLGSWMEWWWAQRNSAFSSFL